MIEIMVAVLVLAVFLSTIYLVYWWFKKRENTREEYALRSLITISTLVGLAITSISSKKGVFDQIMLLMHSLLGNAPPEARPAPFSEKALIFLLVVIVIYFIINSHKKWEGAISSEEAERRRMKRSTSIIPQAISEGKRIVKHKPKRDLYINNSRLDPVLVPTEPNLVWHDHVRELFELWYPSVAFIGPQTGGWHSLLKCWIGRDKLRQAPLVLFCMQERPTAEVLEDLKRKSSSISGKELQLIYVVFRAEESNHLSSSVEELHDGVHVISEEFLLRNIVDFTDYFEDIIRRVEKDCFANTTTSVKDIYTPSAIANDFYGKNIVGSDFGLYLTEWSKKPPGGHLAVLGEYGQGKSTGALMFAYQGIKSQLVDSGGRVPLLLELRGKSPANLLPQELLGAWGQQYKLHASALMKLLIAGRIILIFEGFDEMANVSGAESRISHFRALWRFAYPKTKLIFTGRRNLFFEDKELQVVFRSENLSSTSLCEVLHLCPFNKTQIAQSLRWTDRNTREEIIAAADNSAQLYDIIARPSLLYIVASLWQELRPLLRLGNLTSAQVIDRFIVHSYERQAMKERDLNFMALTMTERRYFHEGLAVYMASREATNQITSADLRAAVERLYNAYPEDSHILDNVLIETEQLPLKKRNLDHEDAIDHIATDVRTHGILVNDLGQRGAFRFAHKSFYELLAAKAHACFLLKIDPIFYRSISAAMDGSIENASKSEEMLRFFSELVMANLKVQRPNDDIAASTFDVMLNNNYERPFLRQFKRIVDISVLRFLKSRIWRTWFLIAGCLLSIFSLTTFSLKHSDRLAAILKDYPSINEFFQPFLVQKSFDWSNTFSVFVFALYLIFIPYATYISAALVIKARRWCAVLMFFDESLHSNYGKMGMRRLIGKATARELIKDVERRYSIKSQV